MLLLHLQQTLADEEEISRDNSRLELLKETLYGQFTSLPRCLEELEKIRAALSKVETGNRCKELLQKLVWPLKQEEVDKAFKTLDGFVAAVDKALTIDTSVTVRQIHSTSKNIEDNTNQLLISNAEAKTQQLQRDELRRQDEDKREATAIREKILGWLTHPDVGEIHNVVSKARKSTETGRWFLDGAVFQEFKETPRSLLWLHGDSGCGKSVLCSTIIEQMKIMCKDSQRCRLAYWYFSVNDVRRRGLENLVRALITQFMPISKNPHPVLGLWEAKMRGIEAPTLPELISTFEQMLREKPTNGDPLDLFIILDALDESNEAEHVDIITMLKSLMRAIGDNIHVLLTSRPNSITLGKDWHDSVKIFKVGIGRHSADEDILAHVTERLENDEELKKWPQGRQTEIKEALTRNGAGMFRWVDCQLQAIRRCRKPKELSRALNEPPRDLHEFYARELANVENNAMEDVRKLLLWMAFPQRPLAIEEVVEILAVDVKSDPPCFDEEDRMHRPEDILRLCGSLVSTSTALDRRDTMDDGAETLHLTAAHASVVDFLQTGLIRIGSETVVSFTKVAASLEMTETCLIYLLHLIEKEESVIEEHLSMYPFAHASAIMWPNFYREALASPEKQELDTDRVRKLALMLLATPQSRIGWRRLSYPTQISRHWWRKFGTNITLENVMPAMFYAAMLGLPDIVDFLIKDGHDIDGGGISDCRTPLIGACQRGWEKIVSLLLDNGANPNAPGVFNILLNAKGIDVNALKPHRPNEDIHHENCRREHCQPLISVAAASGSLDFVKALLAAGADVNIQGGSEGTALEIACHQGRVDLVRHRIAIVKILLDAGVDINRNGVPYGTALVTACQFGGHAGLVRMLLDHGADPNISKCSDYDNALQTACFVQNHEIVNLLLEKGVDPNVHGGTFGSPLHAAFYVGHNGIIDTLLQHGADLKYQGGLFGTVFEAALRSTNPAIIQKALELDLSPEEKAAWLICPVLQGNALKDSLESMSRHLKDQERKKDLENPFRILSRIEVRRPNGEKIAIVPYA
ncbi:hypothetical protein G7Y79_00024g055400 [Physcia stellaris]|nr:hypothetical protein G7Y79_00024g055400 [Physcia stellaris]